jgi:uncharacterized membrane protein YfbV (UPF0208 family)
MKRTFIVILMLTLCGTVAMGQDQVKKPDNGIAQWLKGLQQKISQMKPRREITLSTGVAGVRGAKEDSQAKLYWKGKKGDDTVTEKELTEFQEIVGHLEKDDKNAVAKGCEEFMKEFPDSALIPDVKKTLDLVKAEMRQQEK